MGKVIMCDKIVIDNEKEKRKYWNRRNFYIDLHVNDGFEMQFTAC